MTTTRQRSEDGGRLRLALSIAEATVEAGVGRDSIYQAIRTGALVAKKYGRRTIILRRDLDRFLNSLPNIHDRQPGDPTQKTKSTE